MMKRGRILILFVTMIAQIVFAQQRKWIMYSGVSEIRAMADEKKYVWIAGGSGLARFDRLTQTVQVFDKSNSGLPSANISCVAVDTGGIKWIGTDAGLVKYDGATWVVYTKSSSGLHSEIITAIVIDRYGNKWIGTEDGGVSRLDSRQQWKTFNSSNSPLPADKITCLAAAAGAEIAIGTKKGIAVIRDGEMKVYSSENSQLPSGAVRCIAAGPGGALWIGLEECYNSAGGGIACFHNNKWKIFTAPASGLLSEDITAIAAVNDTFVAVGTGYNHRSSLLVYDGERWNPTQFSGDGVNSILYHDSIYWLGTAENGLVSFSNSETRRYTIAVSPLASSSVTHLLIDEAEIKWMLNDNGHLLSLDEDNWTNIKLPDHTLQLPSALASDGEGNKWIAGSSLLSFDGKWQYHSCTYGMQLNCLSVDADNRKWIGTDSGLIVMSENECRLVPLEEKGKIRCMAIDGSGTKWIGTDSGLIAINEHVFEHYSSANSGIPGAKITSVFIDAQNNKWIATFGGGVCKFDGSAWTVYDTLNSGVPDMRIRDIAEDRQGVKWIATHNGLARFDGFTWKVYNKSNSPLMQNVILSVEVDGNGNKWLCLGRDGVAVFNEDGVKTEKKQKQILSIMNVIVSPNPSGGKFQVTVSEEGSGNGGQICVYDVLGNCVFRNELGRRSVHSVDISAYPRGIYFVEVDTGKQKVNRKIIVN